MQYDVVLNLKFPYIEAMMYCTTIARRAITLFALSTLWACNTADRSPKPPLPTVERVDVARYLGTWTQQALIPNRFQAMCASDTRATYARDGDGLSVLNQCRTKDGKLEEAKGVAKIVEGSNNAKLRVSFFRPFYGDYWVLALEPNYQWVLVGEQSREYGWILSRQARLDDATLNQILDRAVALGYDRAKFVRSVNGVGN
jgi:apolipoprotein D and lipocalin family protein